jgi:hypothetical protein
LYYTEIMPLMVQARLDAESEKNLARLSRQLGWSRSRVVREGLKMLSACYPLPRKTRIIGLGKFDSGIPDLGSDKRHLEGFGR